jgi:hypothetical protein
MINLILPVAGRSSRYPGVRPKWLLVNPNGNLMLTEAIKGLELEKFDKIYIVVLQEHLDEFKCLEGIKNQFKSIGVFDKLTIVKLDKSTQNQPETVAEAIKKEKIKGSIFVKDGDNYFECTAVKTNTICVYDLNKLKNVNASNKSYVMTNDAGWLTNIVEKKVISSQFSCGGYSFQDADQYLEYFERLKEEKDLYLSHIIYNMLQDGINFDTKMVENYIDWGVLADWGQYKAKYCTLFVDIDGTLVINSGQHFEPYWGDTEGIKDNIEVLNKLYDTGKVQIILTTSRTDKYRDATLEQLKREGINYHQIIFNLHHAKRIVINDYSKSNPFKSCDAVNLKRNSSDLKEMLEESLGYLL